ncbi:DUF2752 domain-containing protein [Corynebacterium hindlerae]|uniref:DUF2752 domain-containing protein n=2 Tax=Corynebacterium hindlerae TaxID=699041 RepID=A0A7G5FHV7_9CORY|nr:DUF2752 domain-containing protein [Corynebacterium hindlerae]
MSRLTSHPVAPLFVGATAVCGCVAVAVADPETPGGVIPVCPTKALLGINCPGCGSMRMIQCLTQLRFSDALRYNALGLLFVLILIWAWVAWLGKTCGKKIPDFLQWKHAPVVVGVLIAVWFVIRVLPFEPFRSLQV